MQGRFYAACEDIRALAHSVLRHRIMLNFTAEAEGITTDEIINRIIKSYPNRKIKDSMSKSGSISKYLDPELLAKLSAMEVKSRAAVEGMIEGLHKSPVKGFNVEFSEYRQYVPGDSLRDIDWKVYARTDKYYIKEHEEETNLSGYVIMDTSGSMSYKGSGKTSKLDYAATLAASLSYLMLRQQDSVGLVTFAEGVRRIIRPKTGMPHLKVICNELEMTKPENTTSIGESLDAVGQIMRKRGVFIIFSDLMDNAELVIVNCVSLKSEGMR